MSINNFNQVINRRGSSSYKWDLYDDGVLPLWVADMDFACPSEITDAIRTRLDHPFFGYQKPNEDAIAAICKWLESHHGWKVEPEAILLVPGVVSGFNWVANAIVDKGASAAFQTPVYFPFYKIAENNEIKQIEIPLTNRPDGYSVDFEQFDELLEENTKMFLLCNPHNPVGKVYKMKELEKIGEICLERNIIICSDEIHSDLIFPNFEHLPIASISPELGQSTITLMAPSKTFNIPGLHFSFAICENEKLREKLEKGRNGILEHPNILAQSAAEAAYSRCGPWLQDLLIYLQGNKEFLVEYLKKNIPEVKFTPPEGTYLAWLDCTALNLSPSPFQFFLDNAKIALNDGKMFGEGYEQYVRLNFGCPRSLLQEALDRMKNSIEESRT